MSATMGREGGRVQLEHSDMRRVVNMARMPKDGVSLAPIEETNHHIKKHHTDVRQQKRRGVEFPNDEQVKAAIQ